MSLALCCEVKTLSEAQAASAKHEKAVAASPEVRLDLACQAEAKTRLAGTALSGIAYIREVLRVAQEIKQEKQGVKCSVIR